MQRQTGKRTSSPILWILLILSKIRGNLSTTKDSKSTKKFQQLCVLCDLCGKQPFFFDSTIRKTEISRVPLREESPYSSSLCVFAALRENLFFFNPVDPVNPVLK